MVIYSMLEYQTNLSPNTVKFTYAKHLDNIRPCICVEQTRYYPGDIDFIPPNFNVIPTEFGIEIKLDIPNNAKIYGLGEKVGFLNKSGQTLEMYNRDNFDHHEGMDPFYLSIPFFIICDGTNKTGIFIDNPCRQIFDFKNNKIKIYDNYIDMYIINGDIKEILYEYTALTGRTPIPPDFALGFMQSRYSYASEEEVLDIAYGFETCGIKLSAIFLDIDYMEDFKVFTWNKKSFPDPARLINKLKEKDIETIVIVDAGVCVTSKFYKKNKFKNIFCTHPTYLGKRIYKGSAWAKKIAYPDFSLRQTAKAWGHELKEFKKLGIAGFWNDMNEPSDFNGKGIHPKCVSDDVSLAKYTFKENRNAYGYFMAKATYEQVGGFILTRSGYAGIQKYAAVWTGDNCSSWESLRLSIPMCINLGLSGVPFCGIDVGGFAGNATPELYARWIQLGAFMPFYRAHSVIDSNPHEPWSFGIEVLNIAKKYINYRQTILPYLKRCFVKSSKTGEPIMRPLFWDFEEDIECYKIEDEFMLGEKLLVAPILSPSVRKRMIYFPQGLWRDIQNWQNIISKGEYFIYDAPLDKIPVFERL